MPDLLHLWRRFQGPAPPSGRSCPCGAPLPPYGGKGRPRSLPVSVVARIQAERATGKSLAAIADMLTTEDVATAQGGLRWYPSTVGEVLGRRDYAHGLAHPSAKWNSAALVIKPPVRT
jgi:Recombinase